MPQFLQETLSSQADRAAVLLLDPDALRSLAEASTSLCVVDNERSAGLVIAEEV